MTSQKPMGGRAAANQVPGRKPGDERPSDGEVAHRKAASKLAREREAQDGEDEAEKLDHDDDVELSESESEQVEERETTASRVVHEVIRRQGIEEMNRPAVSLMWSGFAGGVGIFASIMGHALLEHHLPDTPWRPAVSALGYSLGFLIVIMGRLQLFTESTLSAVIPVATRPSPRLFFELGRLWSIVFLFNILGTLVTAVMVHYDWIGSAEVSAAILETSRVIADHSGWSALRAGIPAGFLMAAIAWSLPTARRQEFWIILFFTYFISLGGFAHVIAGSGEAWILWLAGDKSLEWVVGSFLLPALAGNILGGSALFALLAHAQVHHEI